MKFLHALLAILAISTVTLPTANASDSTSLGVHIGNYGHGHAYQHYAPPVVYHAPRVYYYEPVRSYYHVPVISYQYYGGHNDYGHQARHDDRRHGWGNGYRGHNDGHRYNHHGKRDSGHHGRHR